MKKVSCRAECLKKDIIAVFRDLFKQMASQSFKIELFGGEMIY